MASATQGGAKGGGEVSRRVGWALGAAWLIGCGCAVGPAAARRAAAPGETPAFTECISIARSTAAKIRCEVDEIGRQTQLLQAAYALRLDEASKADRRRLAREQAAWSAALEARCAPLARQRGPWASVKAQGCRIDALVERRRDLEPPRAQRQASGPS